MLKGPHHSILSYFDYWQNHLEIEGNLKIVLSAREIIINHKETKKVKDGEDWHGLQNNEIEKFRLHFSNRLTMI